MTYRNIYDKFMIEYDKANVTSSYPSLTLYEVATFLDKAYLALIAQKVTGNNPRRTPFEADRKATEDLRGLVVTYRPTSSPTINYSGHRVDNAIDLRLPTNMLYYVSSFVDFYKDGVKYKTDPVTIIDHTIAQRFYRSSYNIPWIKNPVGYFEVDSMIILYDDWGLAENNITASPAITIIEKPKSFVEVLCVEHQESDTSSSEQSKPQHTYSIRISNLNYQTDNNKIYISVEALDNNVVTRTNYEILQGSEYISLEEKDGNNYVFNVLPSAPSPQEIKIKFYVADNEYTNVVQTISDVYYHTDPEVLYNPTIEIFSLTGNNIDTSRVFNVYIGISIRNIDPNKEYVITYTPYYESGAAAYDNEETPVDHANLDITKSFAITTGGWVSMSASLKEVATNEIVATSNIVPLYNYQNLSRSRYVYSSPTLGKFQLDKDKLS